DRHRGDGITSRDVSTMLRPFRIRPRSVRVGEETAKGYRVDQFEDAFARYLPPRSESVTSVTSVTTAPQSQADVTDVTDVTDTAGAPEDPFADIDVDPMAPPPADPGPS
ncbi:MAG TPA: DUF3631 domain-containing protein, partial [Solirubrobacterales bacterium]|nr:DUF3631 domain-containing protein [Solirubrobacterales bacterium]